MLCTVKTHTLLHHMVHSVSIILILTILVDLPLPLIHCVYHSDLHVIPLLECSVGVLIFQGVPKPQLRISHNSALGVMSIVRYFTVSIN